MNAKSSWPQCGGGKLQAVSFCRYNPPQVPRHLAVRQPIKYSVASRIGELIIKRVISTLDDPFSLSQFWLSLVDGVHIARNIYGNGVYLVWLSGQHGPLGNIRLDLLQKH